jgi:hypothetical protein
LTLSFDEVFMAGEVRFLANRDMLDFNCTGDIKYEILMSQGPAPSNETDVPSDETEIPSDETEIPSDETEIPSDETEIPSDETDIPSDEPEIP